MTLYVKKNIMIDFIDGFQLYGTNKDFIVNDKITLHQPTLREIQEYGEERYYKMIYTLCSVGADLKYQLYKMGKDYTKVSDFALFSQYLSQQFTQEDSNIIFNGLDFLKFEIVVDNETNEIVMYDKENNIVIDKIIYKLIVNFLRKLHGLKRNNEIPGNETTKEVLILLAEEEYEDNKNKPFKPILFNMVSFAVIDPGFKHDESSVLDMGIYSFMTSFKRIMKRKNADLLLQSGYSGFGVDLKKIDTSQLDYMEDLG